MIFKNSEEFISAIDRGECLICLDIGEKTIGMALSDSRFVIASPYNTIRRKKFSSDAQQLIINIEECGVGGVVIGLPINTDGSEGRKCQSVRQFAKNFLKLYEIPITFWDERFSTVIAKEAMSEANLSREKVNQSVDKVAAGYILQSFLDTIKKAG